MLKLKRKLYLVVLGVIVAHLSIAQLSPVAEGDCAVCGTGPRELQFTKPLADLPLNQNLYEKVNGFTHPGTVESTVENQSSLSIKENDPKITPNPPLIEQPPGFLLPGSLSSSYVVPTSGGPYYPVVNFSPMSPWVGGSVYPGAMMFY